MGDIEDKPKPPRQRKGLLLDFAQRRKIAFIGLFVAICLILFLGFVAVIELALGRPELRNLILDNFNIIIGLPLAAVASFIMVLIFVFDVSGDVKFKMFGLEFSGPAGPILLWTVGFLSIVGAIKMLS